MAVASGPLRAAQTHNLLHNGCMACHNMADLSCCLDQRSGLALLEEPVTYFDMGGCMLLCLVGVALPCPCFTASGVATPLCRVFLLALDVQLGCMLCLAVFAVCAPVLCMLSCPLAWSNRQ